MRKYGLKVAALLLSAVFVFAVFPSSKSNADDVNYSFDSNSGTLTISGEGAITQTGVEDAVGSKDNLPKIVKVVIGEGISSIDSNAFANCSKLSEVSISDSVTSIADSAFYCCSSLTSVKIPEGVTSIGYHAFHGCTGLTSVKIPVSVTSIYPSAFIGCTSLKSVEISSTATDIGECAFSGCTSLKSVEISGKVTYIANEAFCGCSALETIKLPSGVKAIGSRAFYRCTKLTSIEIPSGISSIGECAFTDCSNLASVTIPAGVTSIGHGAFDGCSNLASVTIPAGVTSIGSYAFCDCTSLTSITIPASVTSIGSYVFCDCSSLTSITIPEGVTVIGQSAFSDCSSLTSVILPTTVTDIGSKAFLKCESLKDIVFGPEVNIAGDAFNGCPNKNIHYYYNAEYSCEHGTIEGNEVTYGTDKLTIKPEENYELVEVSYAFAGSNEKTIIEPDAGCYRMPDIDASITTRDIVVTASFKLIQKTVTFYDEDGTTVLQSGKVDATTIPTYGGDIPTKPADEQYTYTFAGWTDGTNEYKPTDTLPKVTDDVTYTAMYTGTTNVYTVTFTDDSGKELLSSDVEYGQNPSYKGDTPAKPADAQYTYTFAGWKDSSNTYGPTASLPVVTGDVTYTAVFESSTRKYTVTFVNYDGTLLESSQFQYGQTPIYGGDTPTKAADEQYTYTFSGWTDRIDKYSIDRLPTVTGDVTYKAAFSANNNSGVTPVKPVIEPDIRPAADVPVQTPGVYYLHSLTGDGVNTDVVAAIKRTEDDANCINYFGHAEVDGTTMTVGEQIDVGSGSTIITIKKEFLATLGEGNHTLKVYFNDGGTITIEFTVKAATNNAANVPSTGESMSYYTIAGLMLAGAGVIVFGLGQKKKRTASK